VSDVDPREAAEKKIVLALELIREPQPRWDKLFRALADALALIAHAMKEDL